MVTGYLVAQYVYQANQRPFLAQALTFYSDRIKSYGKLKVRGTLDATDLEVYGDLTIDGYLYVIHPPPSPLKARRFMLTTEQEMQKTDSLRVPHARWRRFHLRRGRNRADLGIEDYSIFQPRLVDFILSDEFCKHLEFDSCMNYMI